MSWPAEIMDCFQSIKPELESDFTPAAYNKLLHTLFPVDTPYTVYPQVHRHEYSFIPSARTTFTVYYKNFPVFLLDLHSYPTLTRISRREAADDHIRMHMRDLQPYCPLSTLNAVSAFGTRLCFYSVNGGGVIAPTRSAVDAGASPDQTPIDWWNYDLLDYNGASRLERLVSGIRTRCEKI